MDNFFSKIFYNSKEKTIKFRQIPNAAYIDPFNIWIESDAKLKADYEDSLFTESLRMHDTEVKKALKRVRF